MRIDVQVCPRNGQQEVVRPLPPALDSFPPRAYASVRPELRAGHPGHGGVVAIAWLKVLI